jgi:hypothetical protein
MSETRLQREQKRMKDLEDKLEICRRKVELYKLDKRPAPFGGATHRPTKKRAKKGAKKGARKAARR